MKRNILITGGAGFIGSFLAESLLQKGFSVTVLDNFSTGSRKNLDRAASLGDLTVAEGDITCDANLAAELVKKSDAVYHLAAAVGVELVVNDPAHTISTNVRGAENILYPAAEYGKRIIVASTSEVYGKSSAAKFAETDDLHLGSPYFSRWSYACSKLLDEFLLMALCHSDGLQGTVVRFFNTVGPRQTGRYGMVMPRFVRSAIAGEPLKVYGSGTQSRCFCHVRDVVAALTGLLDCPASIGNIYNIGSQELISVRALAEKVIEICHSSSAIEMISYDDAYGKGFEDMLRRCPDTAKIEKLLGWRPTTKLDEIIRDIYDFECSK